MCTPAAMIATTIISTGISVYSSMAEARYNKEVAQNNATVAEYEAKDALERGELAEKQRRLDAKNLKGQQTAAIAAGGFSITEGSAYNTLIDTEAQKEEDVFTIRSNAAREAWAIRAGAAADAAQSQLAVKSAQNRALGTALSGASSVAEKWYKYYK